MTLEQFRVEHDRLLRAFAKLHRINRFYQTLLVLPREEDSFDLSVLVFSEVVLPEWFLAACRDSHERMCRRENLNLGVEVAGVYAADSYHAAMHTVCTLCGNEFNGVLEVVRPALKRSVDCRGLLAELLWTVLEIPCVQEAIADNWASKAGLELKNIDYQKKCSVTKPHDLTVDEQPCSDYRNNGEPKGELLTAKFVEDRYGIIGSELTRKHDAGDRMKNGRGFVYRWSFVKKLVKS